MPTTRWTLQRNCALTPAQTLLAWSPAMLALTVVALVWALRGWWWIVAFALVNMVALVVALCQYARHALDGDSLELGADGLLHIECRRGSEVSRTAWPAALVRMEPGLAGAITLRKGRERLSVGALASPPRREAAARELRSLLG